MEIFCTWSHDLISISKSYIDRNFFFFWNQRKVLKKRLLLWLGINVSLWRKGRAIYSYGESRNKKIQSEISTNYCVVQGKKKFASTIASLSNLNIRIADIVMIQWLRSTYFLIFLISNFSEGFDWNNREMGILLFGDSQFWLGI